MTEIKLSNGETVKMRTPKLKDMMASNDIQDAMEKDIAIIGNLTEMTRAELDELDIADFQHLQYIFLGFRFTPPKASSTAQPQ